MFLVDKYGVYAEQNTGFHRKSQSRQIDEEVDDHLMFHEETMSMLRVMAEDNSIPHLIFYGASGSGKKKIIEKFLEMVYQTTDVHRTSTTIFSVTGSGNSTNDVPIEQSNYHIVINPDGNNFDRYLIQDVVKEYAQHIPLNRFFRATKDFKTVLINNVDRLSYYAQTSLRRTMEKYSDTCRFIMWSNSLSRVIEPLRSRCYCFRVMPPSRKELTSLLLLAGGHEKITLDGPQLDRLIEMSHGSVKRALWLLEFHRFGYSHRLKYDEMIDGIIEKLKKAHIKMLQPIRDQIYRLIISNISGSEIIKRLLNQLLEDPEISFETKAAIIEQAVVCEHRLASARREIMQLDYFVISLMRLLRAEKGDDEDSDDL